MGGVTTLERIGDWIEIVVRHGVAYDMGQGRSPFINIYEIYTKCATNKKTAH
jgi:hypothetical protein